MTKIPDFTYKDLIKKLRNAGFKFDRQAKGSHAKSGIILYLKKEQLCLTILGQYQKVL